MIRSARVCRQKISRFQCFKRVGVSKTLAWISQFHSASRIYARHLQKSPLCLSNLGVDETLVQKLEKRGISYPSPIQIDAIPKLLQSDTDIHILHAPTGTGKTLAAVLPILTKVIKAQNSRKTNSSGPEVGILLPSTELALQYKELLTYLLDSEIFPSITVDTIVGKFDSVEQYRHQYSHIAPDQAHFPSIVISTPTHLKRLITGTKSRADATQFFGSLRYLILDEFDSLIPPLPKFATYKEKKQYRNNPPDAQLVVDVIFKYRHKSERSQQFTRLQNLTNQSQSNDKNLFSDEHVEDFRQPEQQPYWKQSDWIQQFRDFPRSEFAAQTPSALPDNSTDSTNTVLPCMNSILKELLGPEPNLQIDLVRDAWQYAAELDEFNSANGRVPMVSMLQIVALSASTSQRRAYMFRRLGWAPNRQSVIIHRPSFPNFDVDIAQSSSSPLGCAPFLQQTPLDPSKWAPLWSANQVGATTLLESHSQSSVLQVNNSLPTKESKTDLSSDSQDLTATHSIPHQSIPIQDILLHPDASVDRNLVSWLQNKSDSAYQEALRHEQEMRTGSEPMKPYEVKAIRLRTAYQLPLFNNEEDIFHPPKNGLNLETPRQLKHHYYSFTLPKWALAWKQRPPKHPQARYKWEEQCKDAAALEHKLKLDCVGTFVNALPNFRSACVFIDNHLPVSDTVEFLCEDKGITTISIDQCFENISHKPNSNVSSTHNQISNGDIKLVVANENSCRGIDLDFSHVIILTRLSGSDRAEKYLHMAGRTARAGKAGDVVAVLPDINLNLLSDIAIKLGIRTTRCILLQ